MNPFVKRYLQKQIFKQKGAIGSAKSVEFSYNALETRMKNLGLDINLIKSEKDLTQALGFVKNMEDQIFAKQFGDTLKKKESAEIFDLDKNKLNPNKTIMGGTQSEEDILQKSIKKNVDEATKKGDFKGIFNQVLRDPEIAREFALSKKFPFKTAEGEEAIPLAMRAKFDEEMGIKSVAPRDYSVEKLVKDFKKFGNASDKDIQTILKSGKSGQIPYVMDNYGMSYSDVIETLNRGDDLIKGLAKGGRAGFAGGSYDYNSFEHKINELKAAFKRYKKGSSTGGRKGKMTFEQFAPLFAAENFATGGRAGFKVGSPSKRAFLKMASGIAATIAAIKSGLVGVPKKEVTKQVVKESVKDVANAPPEYFFNLANKIKLLGKESKVKPQDRVNEYNYKGKNGDDYTLTEDISTGDMQITKDKMGIGIADDKSFDTINDRTVMEYRAGKTDVKDEGLETQKSFKEPDEYEEYRVNFDRDGTVADADDVDDIIKKEIIEEASEVPEKKIKRAGGGVAYMLGE